MNIPYCYTLILLFYDSISCVPYWATISTIRSTINENSRIVVDERNCLICKDFLVVVQMVIILDSNLEHVVHESGKSFFSEKIIRFLTALDLKKYQIIESTPRAHLFLNYHLIEVPWLCHTLLSNILKKNLSWCDIG